MEETTQLLNGRYKLIKQLSSGGMGIVHEAYDMLLKVPVAIKQSLHEEEIFCRAFEREAQLLANLNHPSLPYCIDFFTISTRQFLVMQYIGGKTAEDLVLENSHGLPMATVKDFAEQMLDVAEYLHSESVVHRDIKTLNFKVNQGRLYLLDFGVAYGQTGEMNTVIKGDYDYNCHSRHYSPPEQFRNEVPSPASDLYSIGATLFKLMTGKAPEDADSRLKNGEELTRPRADSESTDFVNGVMRTLSLNPKDRPQSAAEMRILLFPPKPKPLKETPVVRSRKPELAISIVSICSLLLVALVILNNGSTAPNPPAMSSDCQQEISKLKVQQERNREGDNFAEQSEAWLLQANEKEARKAATKSIELDHGNTRARRILGAIERNVGLDVLTFDSPSVEVKNQAEQIRHLLTNKSTLTTLTFSETCDLAWALAQLAQQSGDLALIDKAISYANDILKIQPNSVPALMVLAELAYEKYTTEIETGASDGATGQIPKSLITRLDRVIQAYPLYADAFVARANLYAVSNELEPALRDYMRAANLKPRASTHYLVAATILEKPEQSPIDQENACKFLLLTLRSNPKFSPALKHLKEICEETIDLKIVKICRSESVLTKNSGD